MEYNQFNNKAKLFFTVTKSKLCGCAPSKKKKRPSNSSWSAPPQDWHSATPPRSLLSSTYTYFLLILNLSASPFTKRRVTNRSSGLWLRSNINCKVMLVLNHLQQMCGADVVRARPQRNHNIPSSNRGEVFCDKTFSRFLSCRLTARRRKILLRITVKCDFRLSPGGIKYTWVKDKTCDEGLRNSVVFKFHYSRGKDHVKWLHSH